MVRRRQLRLSFLLAFALLFTACSSEEPGDDSTGLDGQYSDDIRMPPLDSLDNFDSISNDELGAEAKADEVFPSSFDLLDKQSPVRSQGSRGVCSMFSTVALMEHLYLKEGTIAEPNFSEQFLQWSTKVQLGRFQNTDGSSATANLEAIARFGVVAEEDWPYESRPWGTAEDPECTGDNRPVLCYTNGSPSTETLQAPMYKLPTSRWVRTRTRDIQAYMYNNRQSVVLEGTFYYQAWNHGASQLPTNRQQWRLGNVPYPNDADKEDSEARRAGHSVLAVGWDDNREVPLFDGEGNPLLDEDGNQLTEKGFFLFKNSWGTGSFGVDDIDGYGWISYRYVEAYKSARGANMPLAHHFPEIPLTCEAWQVACDGECITSNEQNCGDCGVVCGEAQRCEQRQCVDVSCDTTSPDCQDPICWGLTQCQGEEEIFSSEDLIAIPDNDSQGISSPIEVEGGGLIQALTVDVFIEHSYNGDLRIELVHPSGQRVTLKNNDGTPGRDVVAEFEVEEFIALESAGTWELHVSDHAALDEGELIGWYLRVTR